MRKFALFANCLAVILSFESAESCMNTNDTNISQPCLDQLHVICQNSTLQWLLFDASSKYPFSGLSHGVSRDYGNFDECMSIDHEDFSVGHIKGKYCAFSMAIINPFFNSSGHPNFSVFNGRIKTESFSKARKLSAEEYADEAPNYLTSLVSVCIPNQCTPQEVADFFVLGDPFEQMVYPIPPNDDLPPCLTVDSYTDYTWADITFITFLSLILCLMVVSTTYDFLLHKTQKETKHPLYIAFSVLTNGRKLLAINTTNPEQIQCLNGLRFISMMWVISGHGYVTYELIPMLNSADYQAFRRRWLSQYLGAAPIAVDTFFLLSGFLLAYGYMKVAVKKKPQELSMGVPMMIVHRYIRLTPALAALYFGTVTIFRKMGTGPIWGSVSEAFREPCLKYWWSFFLYFQNYYAYDDMCLNHTWYLSADMQLFILAPLVLIPASMMVKKNLNLLMYCLGGFAVICVIFPMLIRFLDHTIENVYDSHSRIIDYLIGIMLGIWLRETKDRPFPFSKVVNFIIWVVVLLSCVAFIVYYCDVVNYYEHTKDTLFYGLYRPLWCASLAWMIYSCHYGQGGFINWILSRLIFQIGGRLSYCMYLLHAVIEAYYLGLSRHVVHFTQYNVFYIFCGHFIVTIMGSIIWTLAFEAPMLVIEKVIFKRN